MKPSEHAKEIADRFIEVRNDADRFFEPYIQLWLPIELATNRFFKEQDAAQPFHFEGRGYDKDKGDTLLFRSGDWEENWQYGGHEDHLGETIEIPLSFFDAPHTHVERAEQAKAEREAADKRAWLENKRTTVKRIELQLSQAKADLEKEEKDAKL